MCQVMHQVYRLHNMHPTEQCRLYRWINNRCSCQVKRCIARPSEILVNVIVISDVTEDSVIVAVPPTNITVFEPDPVLYVTTASVSP